MSTAYHYPNQQLRQQQFTSTRQSANVTESSSSSTGYSALKSTTYSSENDKSMDAEWDWDLKLNKLLEDLQKSIPAQSESRRVPSSLTLTPSSSRRRPIPERKLVEFSSEYEHVVQQSTPFHLHSPLPTATAEQENYDLRRSNSYRKSAQSTSSGSANRTHRRNFSEGGNGNGVISSGGLRAENGFYAPSNQSQMQFIDASNSVTVLRSAESSPIPPAQLMQPVYGNILATSAKHTTPTTPQIQRKEFYSNSSSSSTYTKYTTAADDTPKNTGTNQIYTNDDFEFLPPPNYPVVHRIRDDAAGGAGLRKSGRRLEFENPYKYQSEQIEKNYNYNHETTQLIGHPLCSSTPKSNGNNDRNYPTTIAAPTPRLMQKQTTNLRNESYKTSCQNTNNRHSLYDDDVLDSPLPNNGRTTMPSPEPQFYTATIIRTETRGPPPPSISSTSPESETPYVPTRGFPRTSSGRTAPTPGEPPKRLDQLLATFDESFVETSKIVGDGGGPHKSVPYGPGTYPIQRSRSVRINESENEIIEKRYAKPSNNAANSTYGSPGPVPMSLTSAAEFAEQRNQLATPGPPVYYPIHPNEPLFVKTSESMEIQGRGDRGKGRMQMERKYQERESSKQSRSEKGGGGALPVPVCLPVCCAAPCVIL